MNGPDQRCPRCDCPDGHERCDHCKVCPHMGGGSSGSLLSTEALASVMLAEPPAPSITILSSDNRTPLVTIYPSGELEYGPGYTPDEAARRFWDAMRYYMPARCPSCGHVAGGEVTP